MSSNRNADEDDIYADMPALEDIVPVDDVTRIRRADETERYRIGSLLAQIEIASCFRNGPEPLFRFMSSLLWRAARR